jgi:hypothetical protein
VSLLGLVTSARIVVIIAIAAFGPNVRSKPLDTLWRAASTGV